MNSNAPAESNTAKALLYFAQQIDSETHPRLDQDGDKMLYFFLLEDGGIALKCLSPSKLVKFVESHALVENVVSSSVVFRKKITDDAPAGATP